MYNFCMACMLIPCNCGGKEQLLVSQIVHISNQKKNIPFVWFEYLCAKLPENGDQIGVDTFAT